MERARKISTQTLAIAILSVLLVASLLMTATGAWFTDSVDGGDANATFGTIDLTGTGVQSLTINMNETGGDVLMPGDTIDTNFTIVNGGTADMFVRFKLEFTGAGAAYIDAATPASIVTEGGVTYNRLEVAEGDFWYVREAAYTDEDAGTDVITETFEILTSVGDAAQGLAVAVSLDIEAVQAANNTNWVNYV
jgi:hypothetical protein